MLLVVSIKHSFDIDACYDQGSTDSLYSLVNAELTSQVQHNNEQHGTR